MLAGGPASSGDSVSRRGIWMIQGHLRFRNSCSTFSKTQQQQGALRLCFSRRIRTNTAAWMICVIYILRGLEANYNCKLAAWLLALLGRGASPNWSLKATSSQGRKFTARLFHFDSAVQSHIFTTSKNKYTSLITNAENAVLFGYRDVWV